MITDLTDLRHDLQRSDQPTDIFPTSAEAFSEHLQPEDDADVVFNKSNEMLEQLRVLIDSPFESDVDKAGAIGKYLYQRLQDADEALRHLLLGMAITLMRKQKTTVNAETVIELMTKGPRGIAVIAGVLLDPQQRNAWNATFINDRLIGIQPQGMTGLYSYQQTSEGTTKSIPITRQIVESMQDIKKFDLDSIPVVNTALDSQAFDNFAALNGFTMSNVTCPRLSVPGTPYLEPTANIDEFDLSQFAYAAGSEVMTTFGGEQQAAFIPTFKTTSIDFTFTTVLGNLLVTAGLSKEAYSDTVTEVEEYVNSNGSMQGQIGRYNMVAQVHKEFQNKLMDTIYDDVLRMTPEYGYSIDMQELWSKSLNLRHFHDLMMLSVQVCNPVKRVDKMYWFNPTSNTGPWIPKKGTKNGDLPGHTIEMCAEKLISKLMSLTTYTHMDQFLQTNAVWTSPLVKPKREVVKRSDIKRKTRLYSNFSAPASVLPQIFSTAFEATRFSQKHPMTIKEHNSFNQVLFKAGDFQKMTLEEKQATIANGSMSGMSFMHGTFEKLIQMMVENLVEGANFVLHYSDNINIFSCFTKEGILDWHTRSLDGVKMEGQHNEISMRDWGTKMINFVGPNNVKSPIGVAAQVVMDRMQFGSKWLMNGYAVDPIGLASGYPATTSMNSYKTQTALAHLLAMYTDGEKTLVELWDEEFEKPQPSFSEIQQRKAGKAVPNTLWYTAQTAANSKLSCDNKEDFILKKLATGQVVVLDLLGHNVIQTEIGNEKVIMPTYRKETLIKMLLMQANAAYAYKRVDADKEAKYKADVQVKLNRIASLKTSIMCGLWSSQYGVYSQMAYALLAKCQDSVRLHHVDKNDLDSMYEESCREAELPFDTGRWFDTIGMNLIVNVCSSYQRIIQLAPTFRALQNDMQLPMDKYIWLFTTTNFLNIAPLDPIDDAFLIQEYQESLETLLASINYKRPSDQVESIANKGVPFMRTKLKNYLAKLLQSIKDNDKMLFIPVKQQTYITSVEKAIAQADDNLRIAIADLRTGIMRNNNWLTETQRGVELIWSRAKSTYITQPDAVGINVLIAGIVEVCRHYSEDLVSPVICAAGHFTVTETPPRLMIVKLLDYLARHTRKHYLASVFTQNFMKVDKKEFSTVYDPVQGLFPEVNKGKYSRAQFLKNYSKTQQESILRVKQLTAKVEKVGDKATEFDASFFMKPKHNSRDIRGDARKVTTEKPQRQRNQQNLQTQIDELNSNIVQNRSEMMSAREIAQSESALSVGQATRSYPLFYDRALIAVHAGLEKVQHYATCMPSSKQIRAYYLKRHVSRHSDISFADLGDVNLSSVFNVWKRDLNNQLPDCQILLKIYVSDTDQNNDIQSLINMSKVLKGDDVSRTQEIALVTALEKLTEESQGEFMELLGATQSRLNFQVTSRNLNKLDLFKLRSYVTTKPNAVSIKDKFQLIIGYVFMGTGQQVEPAIIQFCQLLKGCYGNQDSVQILRDYLEYQGLNVNTKEFFEEYFPSLLRLYITGMNLLDINVPSQISFPLSTHQQEVMVQRMESLHVTAIFNKLVTDYLKVDINFPQMDIILGPFSDKLREDFAANLDKRLKVLKDQCDNILYSQAMTLKSYMTSTAYQYWTKKRCEENSAECRRIVNPRSSIAGPGQFEDTLFTRVHTARNTQPEFNVGYLKKLFGMEQSGILALVQPNHKLSQSEIYLRIYQSLKYTKHNPDYLKDIVCDVRFIEFMPLIRTRKMMQSTMNLKGFTQAAQLLISSPTLQIGQIAPFESDQTMRNLATRLFRCSLSVDKVNYACMVQKGTNILTTQRSGFDGEWCMFSKDQVQEALAAYFQHQVRLFYSVQVKNTGQKTTMLQQREELDRLMAMNESNRNSDPIFNSSGSLIQMRPTAPATWNDAEKPLPKYTVGQPMPPPTQPRVEQVEWHDGGQKGLVPPPTQGQRIFNRKARPIRQ